MSETTTTPPIKQYLSDGYSLDDDLLNSVENSSTGGDFLQYYDAVNNFHEVKAKDNNFLGPPPRLEDLKLPVPKNFDNGYPLDEPTFYEQMLNHFRYGHKMPIETDNQVNFDIPPPFSPSGASTKVAGATAVDLPGPTELPNTDKGLANFNFPHQASGNPLSLPVHRANSHFPRGRGPPLLQEGAPVCQGDDSASQLTRKRKNDTPLEQREVFTNFKEYDVIPGKGPSTHPGNIKYKQLVKERKQKYLCPTATDESKKQLVAQVIDGIEKQGGRFFEYVKGHGIVLMFSGRVCDKVAVALAAKKRTKKPKELPPMIVPSDLSDG